MAGEKWRQIFQTGKETVEGAAVPATRKLYVNGTFSRQRPANMIKIATGTRDNQRDIKLRATQAMATLSAPISADEAIEFLLMTLQGSVTPVAQTQGAPTVNVTPTTVATGGTIQAGTIIVAYTVTGPAGESAPLALPSVTTTGATSTVTVPAVTPLPAGATLVTYYLTGPGGAASTASYAGQNATGAAITLAAPGNGTRFAPASAPSGANLWVFKPGQVLDTQTMEWYDGYNPWQARGCKAEELKFTGDIKADTKLDAQVWARELATANTVPPFAAVTAGLPDRTPNFIQGWEARLYADPLGATPGTTVMPGTMTMWDVTIKNNMGRKYFADNTQATGAIVLGELMVQASITLEGNANAMAEYANWDAATKRLLRIELGNNGAGIGTTALKPRMLIDVPGSWTAVDLTPEDNGTKAFKLTYDYVYDVTNAFGVAVSVYSSRGVAY